MRPSIDVEKILIILHTYFVIITNLIAFNRTAYIIKADSENRKSQIKMLILYLFLFGLNYVTYLIVSRPLNALGINLLSFKMEESLSILHMNTADALIYTVFTCEALYIQLKLIVKFLKLSVDITELQLQKIWEHNQLSFNVLNLLRYIVKSMIQVKLCLIIFKT